jgi:sulfite reductase (NADPH) hemoprotein beta-component
VLEPGADALAAFRRTNVSPQRQRGFSVVTISPARGDVIAGQLEALADLALAHGDGTVRLSSRGHVLLRWVPHAGVPALHRGLFAAGLARDGAASAADVVACPGADVCRLGVTRTRAIAGLVVERVRERLGAEALGARLPVHVSACPNGCSQHHLAAIGLQGSARRLGARAVPQYFVLLGGGVGPQGATFAKVAGKVPARRVPEAVERLTALYLAERAPGEEAGAFFASARPRPLGDRAARGAPAGGRGRRGLRRAGSFRGLPARRPGGRVRRLTAIRLR